ncbi:EamA family transporter [Acidithiobacillus sp. CV18-2]|uniref:EamA family transporter n=1 Tax=Igneacidithiobacillus copahuensis TaxID=2724909 RepID=A0AAE2YPB4_9PROT|nr:EamA family transporter [Igneacidithiobacillus copahuensis]MBU2754909.1 EamA family transporter [Acidithiobacillus sp. CV18-3]MBU2758439.1 EamA family transporter [Acidithiobacillus sp. BN09-2]MBU2778395.1 EamA family transporter [Acidithiobacillus sp. CV18-2]MBU2797482.1 EamA family transporter [Acidithiobacillus sp. VAN18-2]MBU2798261.1 EamA family transporter [Acidithiobacillus sp. VAN18-4]UTV81849.1 DMT family transporter [Acidithiobacillus sp. YTS05]
MRSRETYLAFTAIFLIALIWGYNWVVMKVALQDSAPLLFAALRVVLSAPVLLLFLILQKRSLALPPLIYVVPYGLLQSTGFVGATLLALEYAGAGKTAILVYMMPIWLMLLAWPVLGERLQGLQIPALVLALLGLVVILEPWQIGHSPWQGPFFAILSGISWAASAIWHKRFMPRGQDLITATFWQASIGGLVLLIAALLLEGWQVQWTGSFIAALAYNAVPGTALAYVLWLFALRHLPSGVAGIATLLAPLIGVLAAWLQLGERPSLWEAMGMAAIFSALLLVSWQHLRPKDNSIAVTAQE